jgi:hypothetical protein
MKTHSCDPSNEEYSWCIRNPSYRLVVKITGKWNTLKWISVFHCNLNMQPMTNHKPSNMAKWLMADIGCVKFRYEYNCRYRCLWKWWLLAFCFEEAGVVLLLKVEGIVLVVFRITLNSDWWMHIILLGHENFWFIQQEWRKCVLTRSIFHILKFNIITFINRAYHARDEHMV